MNPAIAAVLPPAISPAAWEPFPAIDLRHIQRLTDDTGMYQHAVHTMPDPNHGYCTDDNARALIGALLYAQQFGDDASSAEGLPTSPADGQWQSGVLLYRYLTFLTYAFNDETRTFRNFMDNDRRWLEKTGSGDSQGRAIWALGLAVNLAPDEMIREVAANLLGKAMGQIERFEHPRSRAFALLGLDEYLKRRPNDSGALELRDRHATLLFDAYLAHATEDWPWWEDTATYDNAKLPHALLVCGAGIGWPNMTEAGLRALRWLLEIQTATPGSDRAHLSIIGNDGWMKRDGHRARFDQQPLEAYSLVHACLTAAVLTSESTWAEHAWRCFEWFRGRNDLG